MKQTLQGSFLAELSAVVLSYDFSYYSVLACDYVSWHITVALNQDPAQWLRFSLAPASWAAVWLGNQYHSVHLLNTLRATTTHDYHCCTNDESELKACSHHSGDKIFNQTHLQFYYNYVVVLLKRQNSKVCVNTLFQFWCLWIKQTMFYILNGII